MSTIEIDIKLVDGKQAVSDSEVDYVPFGVKVLKLQVRRTSGEPRKVWIRTKNLKRDEDPCAIYGYADDGDDLWAVWGAGDVMGFCAKYAEQAGTKKAVVLDDEEPHVIYLNLIHRPRDPATHELRPRQLTIVAVTADDDVDALAKQPCQERQHRDQIVAERTFTLTVPSGITHPSHPQWTWCPDGSEIVLAGNDLPRYVSRWWSPRQVEYARVDNPPLITLDYARLVNGKEGAIDIWLGPEGDRQLLARVEGHLTFPIHDLRWFVPELYRFYDDQLYVLRLWFFWVDEHIDAQDLLSFLPDKAAVPDDQRAALRRLREGAEKEAAGIMEPRLGTQWGKLYEIPDVERFDIVFDPDNPRTKYCCTDGHWREFWLQVDYDQPCQCKIAAPKDALRVLVDYVRRYLINFGGGQEPQPITNPLEEEVVLSEITEGRCEFDAETGRIVRADGLPLLSKAPGTLGKNAPSVTNAKPLSRGLSSDVLEG